MDHERDCCYHNQHHGRNRIEKESDADDKFVVELQPVLIEHQELQAVSCCIHKFGSAREKVEICGIICQDECYTHAGRSKDTSHLMAHELAKQAQEQKHEEGYCKY